MPTPVFKADPNVDYNKIPQRTYKYPASDRAKKIVHEAITMDSLFGCGWPLQWSSPEGPEFHDVMAHMHDAGFKVLAINPSSDAAGNDPMLALEFFLKKINEHPERYKIVRTTRDIDEAIAERKLGMYFTHQGVAYLQEDLDRVAVFRQLGYGDGVVDAKGDKFTQLVETPQGPVLFTSAPVRDASGKLSGVLLLGTRLQSLLADTKSQALADLVILDGEMDLLQTTLAEPAEGFSSLKEAAQPFVADLQIDPQEVRLYNRDFKVYYQPFELRGERLGWLGTVLPTSFVASTEATSRNTFILLFSLGYGRRNHYRLYSFPDYRPPDSTPAQPITGCPPRPSSAAWRRAPRRAAGCRVPVR